MHQDKCRRRSFTLVELLISVAMIALLASMALMALYGVTENAKEVRTRAQIARLHTMLTEKLDAYRTRAVPLSIPAGTVNNPAAIAWLKLMSIRQLMRMELPERITDLNLPTTPMIVPTAAGGTYTVTLPNPSAWRSYRRVAGYATATTIVPPTTWTSDHQYSECLYLIISSMRDGDRSAIEFFLESEIGDVDGDGMKEILDGWGRPIYFFRWAPGFTWGPGVDGKWGTDGGDDNGDGQTDDIFERGLGGVVTDDVLMSDVQTVNAQEAPDPFDPLRVDYRWWDTIAPGQANTSNDPFALVPLIYSAGRDGVYDLYDAEPTFAYGQLPTGAPACRFFSRSSQIINNDPYIAFADPNGANSLPVFQIGMPYDGAGESGVLECLDNITNHLITTR